MHKFNFKSEIVQTQFHKADSENLIFIIALRQFNFIIDVSKMLLQTQKVSHICR